MRTAVLLGATGLVGGHALRLLAHDGRWDRVVTLDRRPLATASARHAPHVVDVGRLAEHADLLAGDDLFCCLGTTMKQAGSEEAFRRVDLEIPAEAARLAHGRGAGQMLLVSALGADPNSRIFYNRTKGEAEAAVRAVGFESVGLFRPSLLTGDRDEGRPGEQAAAVALRVVSPLLLGPLSSLRPTPAEAVARALVAVAAERPAGVRVYGPGEIKARAGRR
jgi:uncharacterized protein YbjT (DUF2867 family)